MLNTVDELFMNAIHTVRDLINEDNLSLTFFSELEKNITKKALGQKQNAEEIEDKQTTQKKTCKNKM